MLKNFGYDGVYKDGDISVNLLLENPLEHNLDATELAFSVKVGARNAGTVTPRLEDFTFYIMDEVNNLHNTGIAPYLGNIPEDDEPVQIPDGIIHTSFKHDFLFQDLRIAFYYRHFKQITIIELKH